MKCLSCNLNNFNIIKYDNHAFIFHYKYFLRNILKKIGFLISDSPFFYRVKRASDNTFKGQIYICKNCGFGEAVNKPSKNEVSKYYNKFYWQIFRLNKNKNLLNTNFKKNLRAIHQCKFILKYLKNKKNILEIGGGECNTSLLLREKVKNIKIECCDSLFWKKYYKKNNIVYINKMFPFFNKKKYDLIISSHHLEHMLDLKKSIQHFHKLLKNDGLLFIEVPNTTQFYWKNYIIDTPHLYFFTKKSFRNIFAKFGFKLVDLQIFGNSYEEILEKKKQNYQKIKKNGAYLKAILKKI